MGQAADLLDRWGDARAVGHSIAQALLLNACVAVASARAAPTCDKPYELSDEPEAAARQAVTANATLHLAGLLPKAPARWIWVPLPAAALLRAILKHGQILLCGLYLWLRPHMAHPWHLMCHCRRQAQPCLIPEDLPAVQKDPHCFRQRVSGQISAVTGIGFQGRLLDA